MTDKDFFKIDTVVEPKAQEERLFSRLPEKIGPYKIESLLNKGGMGLLYLGIHPDTKEPIAIKILSPKYLKNKEMQSRFINEAKIIARTKHPNIVKLYDFGQWEKGLYIAMEFIQGISLRQFIRKQSFSLKKALEIILQVSYALCHLHVHGVIHRDLKPENILITENGDIKVIDFGISQILHAKQEKITLKKKKMGTPFYTSPEQTEDPSNVTHLTDIYALGIIAYELILGKSTHGIIHLALLPKGLRQIIGKSLEIDPRLRYQDIVDLITAVSEYLRHIHEEKFESEEPIQTSSSFLLPEKPPLWPEFEIALSLEPMTPLGSLYIDFFSLSNNRFAVVLGQSSDFKSPSPLQMALLSGMMQIAIRETLGPHSTNPVRLVELINALLVKDSKGSPILFSILILSPNTNELGYISCGGGDLWHIRDGQKKIKTLTTPNKPLGTDIKTSFFEAADRWNPGDTLFLHTFQNLTEEEVNQIAKPHLMLSLQPLSTKFRESFEIKTPQKKTTGAGLIGLHRLF